MAYTITPLSGVDLVNLTTTNTNSAGTAIPTFGPLGAEVFGDRKSTRLNSSHT